MKVCIRLTQQGLFLPPPLPTFIKCLLFLFPPQEERRLRTAYEAAEGSEREKFALFSAAVRESHEKERTRAERTKNWSIIGSVLGALIGVMGSTYINRVRLQVSRVNGGERG